MVALKIMLAYSLIMPPLKCGCIVLCIFLVQKQLDDICTFIRALLLRALAWYNYLIQMLSQISATQSDSDFHIYDDPDLGPFFGSSAKPTLRLFCKVYGANSAMVNLQLAYQRA